MNADLYIEAGLPSDEELERITDYVGHYMTRAERDAFEAQLQDDDAFFYRVAPVIDAWYGTGSRPGVEFAGQQAAVRRRQSSEVRDVRPSRWPRRLAFATLATAAGLFLMVREGTHGRTDAPPTVAKNSLPPTPASPPRTIVVPPRPTGVAVRPHITQPLPTPAPVVAVTEPDPVLVTVDSTAEAAIARWADSVRAAGFIPPTRVTDTVEAVGVQTTFVYQRPAIDSTTKTVLQTPTAVDARPASTQNGGLLGVIKRLFGIGKPGGTP